MKVFLSGSTLFLLLFAFCFYSCQKESAKPSDDYIILGQLASFRINPDLMLKVEGNRVYTTNRLPAIDVNAMPLFYMLNGSDSLLNSIKTLTTNIPAQLLMTKTETVGTMVADAGHLYVEVRKGGISQHWFIEANAPGYLTNFTALVRGVLWKVAN